MNSREILRQQEIEYQECLAMDIKREQEEEAKKREEEEKRLKEEQEIAEYENQIKEDEKNRLSPKSLRLQRLKYFETGQTSHLEKSPSKTIDKPNKQKCCGTTKSGKPCLKFKSKNSEFCHLHLPK